MAEGYRSFKSLSHSKRDCKYEVVLIPKKRRKALFGQARRYLTEIFHALAHQKERQSSWRHIAATDLRLLPPNKWLLLRGFCLRLSRGFLSFIRPPGEPSYSPNTPLGKRIER